MQISINQSFEHFNDNSPYTISADSEIISEMAPFNSKIERLSQFLQATLSDPGQRKHLFRWLFSRQKDYLLKARLPWLPFDAIDYLAPRVKNDVQVFEYGSGGSTLFWLKHGATCVSIEHDPDWFTKMQPYIRSFQNIDYRLVQPEAEPRNGKGEAPDAANPARYLSGNPAYHGYNFRKYVSQIDSFPPAYFDIVLVDGRARPSCIAHSTQHIKMGGLLVLDDPERDHYTSQTQEYLQSFCRQEFYSICPTVARMRRTDIYIRES